MRFFGWLLLAALMLLSCRSDERPAGLMLPHPDDASKQVEYFVEQPVGQGPWPTVILLHGHQDGARPGGRDFVDWGVLKGLAGRGYLAVAVSQPGYGRSSGPADFSGPFTQHAVSGVLARLRADGLVDERLLIQGISRGAVTAGLLAAADHSVSGLVLISGAYDLQAYVADAPATAGQAGVVAAILAETGGDADALRTRSVLHAADRIRAATLVLSGGLDDRTSAEDARRLTERLQRNGVSAELIMYPDHGHRIPVDVRNRDVDPFVDRILRSEPPSPTAGSVRSAGGFRGAMRSAVSAPGSAVRHSAF